MGINFMGINLSSPLIFPTLFSKTGTVPPAAWRFHTRVTRQADFRPTLLAPSATMGEKMIFPRLFAFHLKMTQLNPLKNPMNGVVSRVARERPSDSTPGSVGKSGRNYHLAWVFYSSAQQLLRWTWSHDDKVRLLPRITWTKRSSLLAYAILFCWVCCGLSASA